MDLFIAAIFLLVLVTGLLGTIFPILPGILLMWAAVVGYGFVAGFDVLGIGVIVVATILTAVSIGLGVLLPKQAADAAGASKKSQIASIIGAIIGFFVIPIIGIFVGAVAGIALAEYLDKGEWDPAWASTKGVLTGMGIAALAQFAVGMVILIIWIAWAAISLGQF